MQSGTLREQCAEVRLRVMRIGHADTADRRVSIERLIERFRLEAVRRMEQRAMALWRKMEARQALAGFEKPLERIH